MKLVITAKGPGLEHELDPRFGRAAWYLLVDSENGLIEARENEEGAVLVQGAGPQAAQTVANLGAAGVVTGQVGPKASQALQSAQIDVYTGFSGSAAEALEAWRRKHATKAPAAGTEE